MLSSDAGRGPADPPIRLLIVDDHAMVAESLRRALDAFPDIVAETIATSGTDAIDEAHRAPPDVALIDHRLPGDDGVRVGQLLRAEHPDLACLLMSGTLAGATIAAALGAGFCGCIEKTSPIDRLAPAIRLAHAGELVLPAIDLGRLFPITDAAEATELSARELDILELMREGHTNKAIAASLILSVNTVRKHVQSILAKLGAHSKLEAVAVAHRRDLFGDR